MAEGDPFRQLSQSTEVPSTATCHLVPLPTDTGFWLRGEEELRAAPGEQHAGGAGPRQGSEKASRTVYFRPDRFQTTAWAPAAPQSLDTHSC